MATVTSTGKQTGQKGTIQHHYNNDDLLQGKTPTSQSTLKMNNRCLMQPERQEFKGQTNWSKKHINNVLLIGDINLINALQNDLAPGCRIQTIKSNRYQDLVKRINNLSKFKCFNKFNNLSKFN